MRIRDRRRFPGRVSRDQEGSWILKAFVSEPEDFEAGFVAVRSELKNQISRFCPKFWG
jgi:hypothetical protein